MHLSKAGYYSDFVVYPTVVLVITVIEFYSPLSMHQIQWLLACSVGVVAWTLAEYLIHRFVFHEFPLIARMHDMHHANPGALIGAPIWLSLSSFALGVFIPLWWSAGFDIAGGFITGLVIGYLWYVAIHTAIHRWHLDQTSFLYQAKLRHIRHHYRTQEKNFGVSTLLWDRVFGTVSKN